MSSEPKALGTLIVVVGKARNLPNKSRFGKQDPFCSVQVGKEKHKTKSIKRGGQHPEWDEELRFTIMEDVDDMLAAAAAASSLKGRKDDLPPLPSEPGVVTPATLASNARKGAANTPKKKKASKSMTISCFADDPKEPELIGEAVVPLDEALQKGEVDEWYEFSYKDKYSGEVYLELTYYSNEAPPVKRNVPRPSVYGSNAGAPSRPGIPTSVSVTGMNLYIPPYQQPPRASSPAPQQHQAQQPHRPPQMTGSNSFAELGLPPRASSVAAPGPGQQQFPPGSRPGMKHSSTTTDMLSGQMTAMSLGPGSRPGGNGNGNGNTPYNAQSVNSHQRHSFSTTSQPPASAPWAPLLPQNQQQQQPHGTGTPLPRPISSMDVSGQWNGAQSTPPQRPVSSNAMPSQQPQQQQAGHHRTGSVNLGVPAPYNGGVSQSASYTNLPRPPTVPPPVPEHHRAPSPQPPQQQGYPPHRQPSPQPQQYPPHRVPSPLPSQPSQQFQQPPRAPSPQPPRRYSQPQQVPYTPPPRHDSYGRDSQFTGQQHDSQYGGHQQQNQYQSPQQQNVYQSPAQQQNAYQSPAQQPYSPGPPPPLPHTPQHPSSGYTSYNSPATPAAYPAGRANSMPPHQRHDSLNQGQYSSPAHGQPQQPLSQSPPSTSTGAYVPWYMQTQSQSPSQQHTGLPHPPNQQGHYQQNHEQHPPNPPPPPRHGVGYYPSDELYAGQQNQPPQNQNPYGAPPPAPQFNQQQQQPPPQQQQSDYSNWNNQYSQQPQQSSTLAYAQQDAPSSWANPARAPSPLSRPPEQPPAGRTNTDWRSYLSGLGGSSAAGQGQPPAPQQLNAPPPVPQRVASPGRYGAQADWYTPPPNVPSSISNGWQGQGQNQSQQGQGQGQWQGQQQW